MAKNKDPKTKVKSFRIELSVWNALHEIPDINSKLVVFCNKELAKFQLKGKKRVR